MVVMAVKAVANEQVAREASGHCLKGYAMCEDLRRRWCCYFIIGSKATADFYDKDCI